MGATFVVLVLTAAFDGPPNQEPLPPRPHVIGSAQSVAPGRVVKNDPTSRTISDPLQGCVPMLPAQGSYVHGREYRGGPPLPKKFGYCYYYALIPQYGPTCYNYRWQFDYPWHR